MLRSTINLPCISAKLALMGRIAENINRIKSELGNTRLIVVSKYRAISEIETAYQCGQRLFAENRVQALLERKEVLPNDIEWHLIGHLQTNKVKYIAPFIGMIQSVDSLKLLQEINKQAEKNRRTIECLVQIHVAQEETKFGFTPDELTAFFANGEWKELRHIQLRGLMAMASLTSDKKQIAAEFEKVALLFNAVKSQYFPNNPEFSELSIGMSSDYLQAIQHGSTMVRIGSAVFE